MISKSCKIIMSIRGCIKCIWIQAELMVVKGYILLPFLSPARVTAFLCLALDKHGYRQS